MAIFTMIIVCHYTKSVLYAEVMACLATFKSMMVLLIYSMGRYTNVFNDQVFVAPSCWLTHLAGVKSTNLRVQD